MGKFKKALLGLVGIVVVASLVGGCGGSGQNKANDANKSDSSSTTQQQKSKQKDYAEADINVLLSEAKDNAAAANQNYKGKAVKIIGVHVYNIDSDVKYG